MGKRCTWLIRSVYWTAVVPFLGSGVAGPRCTVVGTSTSAHRVVHTWVRCTRAWARVDARVLIRATVRIRTSPTSFADLSNSNAAKTTPGWSKWYCSCAPRHARASQVRIYAAHVNACVLARMQA